MTNKTKFSTVNIGEIFCYYGRNYRKISTEQAVETRENSGYIHSFCGRENVLVIGE